jgi:hypothetical protein
MIKLQGSVVINRPVEQVYEFMADVKNIMKWDHEAVESRQISPGPVGVGTKLEVVYEARGKPLILNIVVTGKDLNKRISYKVESRIGDATTVYSFEPVESGTRFTKMQEMEGKGLLKFKPILRHQFNQAATDNDLASIKGAVESSVTF